MTFHSLASFLILTATLVVNAQAATQKETVKDWTASVNDVNTGEDLRKTCTARTSAKDAEGQGWTLFVEISNGDVLPPDAYPQIVIVVAAGDAITGKDAPVVFSFGDKNIEARFLSDGSEVTINNVKETSLALLKAFAAGDKLAVTFAGKPSIPFSLAGFTASYRKLGNWCGFATTDVAK